MSLGDISQIKDYATRHAIAQIWKRLGSWQGDQQGLAQFPSMVDARGYRLTGLADPTTDSDALSRGAGMTLFGPVATRDALQAGGAAPLNVNGLLGQLAEAQRMGIRVWPDTATALPPVATGRPFEVIAWRGQLYYFSPTPTPPGLWVLLTAGASLNEGTHANRPSLTTVPVGTIYYETDRGHFYRVTLTGTTKAWTVIPDAGMMRGTLSPDQKPGALGTDDTGFRFWSTDFLHMYRWSGAAWGIVYNDLLQIAGFATASIPTGWAPCDGTAAVTRSTSIGGTTTFTVPDMNATNRFARGNTAPGGTGGAASYDPPSTASGAPSATTTVQSGAGATVPTSTHTHNTDLASFSLLPPYYDVVWAIRI